MNLNCSLFVPPYDAIKEHLNLLAKGPVAVMFSWKKQARFEVVVDQGGYSSIDGIFEDQRQATERATYLLSLAKYSRVQVVQVAKHTQTVIFERASQGGGTEVVGITPIDEAQFLHRRAGCLRLSQPHDPAAADPPLRRPADRRPQRNPARLDRTAHDRAGGHAAEFRHHPARQDPDQGRLLLHTGSGARAWRPLDASEAACPDVGHPGALCEASGDSRGCPPFRSGSPTAALRRSTTAS